MLHFAGILICGAKEECHFISFSLQLTWAGILAQRCLELIFHYITSLLSSCVLVCCGFLFRYAFTTTNECALNYCGRRLFNTPNLVSIFSWTIALLINSLNCLMSLIHLSILLRLLLLLVVRCCLTKLDHLGFKLWLWWTLIIVTFLDSRLNSFTLLWHHALPPLACFYNVAWHTVTALRPPPLTPPSILHMINQTLNMVLYHD